MSLGKKSSSALHTALPGFPLTLYSAIAVGLFALLHSAHCNARTTDVAPVAR